VRAVPLPRRGDDSAVLYGLIRCSPTFSLTKCVGRTQIPIFVSGFFMGLGGMRGHCKNAKPPIDLREFVKLERRLSCRSTRRRIASR
jgi:hypothetical protein